MNSFMYTYLPLCSYKPVTVTPAACGYGFFNYCMVLWSYKLRTREIGWSSSLPQLIVLLNSRNAQVPKPLWSVNSFSFILLVAALPLKRLVVNVN